MLTLPYPKRQSIAFSTKMVNLYNLAKETPEEELRFDLSKSESLTPFGIVMLTAAIYESLSRGKKCKYIKPLNPSLQRFLSEIGFNRFFRLKTEDSLPIGLRSGKVQVKRVKGLDALLTETLMEIIGEHVNLSAGLKGSLSMSLQEMMTNVVDHSGTQNYYVCAWTYPRKKQLRLCIADLGIGILQSLKNTAQYSTLSKAHDAIILATKSGVTSRPEMAGLGLNHIKSFISVNEGRMCIISGNGKIFWKFDKGKTLKQKMILPFGGTIIKLIINTDKESLYFLSDEEDYLV